MVKLTDVGGEAALTDEEKQLMLNAMENGSIQNMLVKFAGGICRIVTYTYNKQGNNVTYAAFGFFVIIGPSLRTITIILVD